jgi:hypothetical protein
MHILVWMWEFGIPDARPETLRYADSIAESPIAWNSARLNRAVTSSRAELPHDCGCLGIGREEGLECKL